jgi:hypothetical protein
MGVNLLNLKFFSGLYNKDINNVGNIYCNYAHNLQAVVQPLSNHNGTVLGQTAH